MSDKSYLYEKSIANYFKASGYIVELTPQSNDYGVDCFAIKGKEKLAIQAKMYGDSNRKVNRKSIMELYGAAKYFDCNKAIIVTNGLVLPDAYEVAQKLGVDIRTDIVQPIEISTPASSANKQKKGTTHFYSLWNEYVKPMKGCTLINDNNTENEILDVDDAQVIRKTSNGNISKIPVEVFQWAVNRIELKGFVTRDEINQEFPGRYSSGTVLILSHIPKFEVSARPLKISKKK